MKMKPTYVKRYPDLSPENIRVELRKISKMEKTPYIQRAISKIESRMRTIPKEGSKERAIRLIEKSKEVCDKYYIDIEVFDLENAALVKIYMLSNLCDGELKDGLTSLISIADAFSIDVENSGEFDYVLGLIVQRFDYIFACD